MYYDLGDKRVMHSTGGFMWDVKFYDRNSGSTNAPMTELARCILPELPTAETDVIIAGSAWGVTRVLIDLDAVRNSADGAPASANVLVERYRGDG